MRISKNEKGVTLLIVIMLTAVALIISAGLLYMVVQSTKMSGSTKRYKTVYEAATGGVEIACELINAGSNFINPGIQNYTPGPTLAVKLNNPANTWPATYSKSVNINGDQDASFTLGGNNSNQYKVYIKIIDMVGNMTGVARGVGMGLHTSGVVQNAGSSITAVNTPRLFTIEVLAQNTNVPTERARLSVLYQY